MCFSDFSPAHVVLESHTLLFIWLCVFTILQRTFKNVLRCSSSRGHKVKHRYLERTRIMAFNNLFTLYGGTLMHVAAWFVVFGFIFVDQGGQLYRPAYTWTTSPCLSSSYLFLPARLAQDQIPLLKRNQIDDDRNVSSTFYSDMGGDAESKLSLFAPRSVLFVTNHRNARDVGNLYGHPGS